MLLKVSPVLQNQTSFPDAIELPAQTDDSSPRLPLGLRQPDSLMMIGIDHDAAFSEDIRKATPRFKIDSMPSLIARISAS